MGQKNKLSGFGVRVAAFAIDFAVVYFALMFVRMVVVRQGLYFPFELTFVILFVVYNIAAVLLFARTIGKAFCGLRVCRKSDDEKKVGVVGIVVREAVGKLLTLMTLGLGFAIPMMFTRSKRALHDYVGGVKVVRSERRSKRVLFGECIGVGLCAYAVYAAVIPPLNLFMDGGLLREAGRDYLPPYASRELGDVVDVQQMTDEEKGRLDEWFKGNVKEPEDYAVEMAKTHDLLLVGEAHDRYEELAYFNRILPRLYEEADVRVVGMECMRAADNGLLTQIVTADEFDEKLALYTARKTSCWKAWGYKGYWDVMKTVWEINQKRDEGERPMRLVGVFPDIDLSNMPLVLDNGDVDGDFERVPMYEKLRVGRFALDLPMIFQLEVGYAHNIEEETIKKNEKGVLLVGAAHASLRHKQRQKMGDGAIRMGYLLHALYGDRVGHILLHSSGASNQAIVEMFESYYEMNEGKPFAISLAGSSFGKLTDSTAEYYSFGLQSNACLDDIATGYVMLNSEDEVERCEWLEGFVSDEMYGEYKPYFEVVCKKKLDNADKVNAAFRARQMK
ncbi:RDD family protein [Planctomycetota bacterium]|nr:RDD family protein [Planctomycetota bacterium]